MRLLAKVGANLHRPLSKFDRVVRKFTKNLARTWQQTKTTYTVDCISGWISGCSAKARTWTFLIQSYTRI